MTALRKTPLYPLHEALGGRIIEFGEWLMPLSYSTPSEEHLAVRSGVGLFDVSHMGEVVLSGPRALEAAQRLVTNNLKKIIDGQALYTVMCREEGGIVDDVIVYRESPQQILICVNAANRAKDYAWIEQQASTYCQVEDQSDQYAQIAIQGPKAIQALSPLTREDIASLKVFHFVRGDVAGATSIIARTGYTGEDGFEVYCPAEAGVEIWNRLMEAGEPLGIKPAGLAARDTLRLEVGYALYGNDIGETTNPLEAGLGWVVKWKKGDFIGRGALEALRAGGLSRKLVGFEMIDPAVPRHGYAICHGGEPVGEVTSGAKSPSLRRSIGMGYVPVALASPDQEVSIHIRDRAKRARVVELPFYRR